MNSIRRAITAERKRILTLSLTSILQEQHASFTSTTLRTLKSSKTSQPEIRSQPPSTTSSSSGDAVQKEQVTWPKPSEIPWQAKVVNSVNLIGQVKVPVQFEASSDGKNWAGTIISQDADSESSASLPSFWIPVIFEGDLAHIAMCHLKEKDYVHVAGHLSVDILPFRLSEVRANVQVMVHSINFVKDIRSEKRFAPSNLDKWAAKNSAIPENDVFAQQSLKEFGSLSKRSSVDEAFEQENNSRLLDGAESSPVHNLNEAGHLHSDHKVGTKIIPASWRDLVTISKQWLDNRENKKKGVVKANYPDFKHKDTGVGLWLDKAPAEVLQGLGELEFMLLDFKLVLPSKGEKDGDSWKHLIENPNKWWDNRLDKKSKKSPDFKNKDSGKALWLGDAPSWALSSLPPMKAETVDVDTKKAWASS